MGISDALKNSIVIGIELHASCLIIIMMLYIHMRMSFIRNSRDKEFPLTVVYIGSCIMLISDCLWSSLSAFGKPGDVIAYIINLAYFISSSAAAVCWYIFCIDHLNTKLKNNITLRVVSLIPYAVVMLLYLLSPLYGFIFSIENGEYIRGNLFYLDPVIKMGYIGLASILAIISGRKEDVSYLKRGNYHFALFGIPVLICGILQTITGVDFNCLGVAFGLILVYVTGITNPDSENTDAIYSLANSFDASYIVNMDTGLIRPLHRDTMHDDKMPEMKSADYTSHFNGILSKILLPEDREKTLEAYNLNNVEKRFKIDKAFNIRYRVKEQSGLTSMHSASFIRATGDEGKREFLLGVNEISSDSLLYERNELLKNENQRLEQINSSIIESVAKIVEARDGESGDHIVRVKKLTEILAEEIMKDYPEYNLDEEKVKLISSASVLHDVGKIVIPDAVLLKPARLTKEEFEIMKTHSAKGCDILNMFPLGLDDAFLEYALNICRWHHEKYDGKGYPDGLKGENIPIAAQIVSLADCFDALVSDRPYKKAYTPEKAFEMIRNGECGMFSPKIIDSMEKKKRSLTELAETMHHAKKQ